MKSGCALLTSITALFFSFSAMAWDQNTYETIRETMVIKMANTTSSRKSGGRLRHFDWNTKNNYFAEALANRIASDENAPSRAKRFSALYQSIVAKFSPAERSSYNPHLNAKMAATLAEQASESEELAAVFLDNLQLVSSSDLGHSVKKKQNLYAAYQRALLSTERIPEHKELAVLEKAQAHSTTAQHNDAKHNNNR